MNYIELRRKQLGLTQTRLAQISGISRAQLQRLEKGVALASPHYTQTLESILGIKLMSQKALITERERQNLAGVPLFELEDMSRSTWLQASRLWGVHGLSNESWSRLATFFHTDSARECSALAQLAAGGAEIRLDSPLLWGFKQLVPVDRHDRFLGVTHLPCLFFHQGGTAFVFWPQMRVRAGDVTWRLDGLVFFRHGSVARWLVVEFDGRGHDSANDAYRASQLRLPEVRISGQEIAARQVMALLLKRAPTAEVTDFSHLVR